MSRALLSEACERDESWQCLPSGLRTATMECVLWEGCGAGRGWCRLGCSGRGRIS